MEAGPCTPCPEGQTTYFTKSITADACYGKKTTIAKIHLTFGYFRQILNEILFCKSDPSSGKPGEEWNPYDYHWEKCRYGQLNHFF